MGTILLCVGCSIFLGILLFVIYKSIKMPKERTIQTIVRFKKHHKIIMSVEGHHLNDPKRKKYFSPNMPEWEIIKNNPEYKQSLGEKWNIYFFLWPIYKTYVYEFSYTKSKKSELKEGDVILWHNEDTSEYVVARSGTSDYIDFQTEYPTITGDLYSKEMAKVLVFTNNTIRVTNPFKMMFKINNWMNIVMETIGGALKGVIGDLKIQEMNQIKSEGPAENSSTADFTNSMKWINKGKLEEDDGIEDLWGARLVKSVFKASKPSDAKAKELFDSFLLPQIAQKTGEAAVITAENEGKAAVITAKKKAEAYSKEQKAIVEWKKKFLVDTGLAKTDGKGNITELIPDANTKVSTEALKELSKLTGTLVIGDLQTMLNIKQSGGQL